MIKCEICGSPISERHDPKQCIHCSTVYKGAPSRGIAARTLSTGYHKKISTPFSTPCDQENIPSFSRIPTAPDLSKNHKTPRITQEKSATNDNNHSPSTVVLDGKYRLVDELGRGSMGTVFLAQDLSLKRNVAVKFLLPELVHSKECALRFEKEAIAMASIRNENVAHIFSFGEDKGTPYFVMEYIEGETLEFLIDSYNRRSLFMPIADAVDIMTQVLIGVNAIHQKNAIHRDIKPGNIMLSEEPPRAVIMDFGLARDIMVDDDLRTLAGTPAYIAPELVEGKKTASTSKLTDIYSLGATFYELLTGSIPFDGNSWVEILQKHIAQIPDFPSSRRPGIPEELDEIVMRAMSKDPSERYQDCEEFLDDILSLPETVTNAVIERISGRRISRSGSNSSGKFRRSPRNKNYTDSGNMVFRSTPSATRGRLLVADISPSFRSEVFELIKTAVPGCRIHSATDGIMAFDMFKSIKPHVFILNLSLPEMNGFELIASIVNDPDFDNTTTIVVTENSGTKDAQLLKSMGVKHFWTKPIDTGLLLETIITPLEKPFKK